MFNTSYLLNTCLSSTYHEPCHTGDPCSPGAHGLMKGQRHKNAQARPHSTFSGTRQRSGYLATKQDSGWNPSAGNIPLPLLRVTKCPFLPAALAGHSARPLQWSSPLVTPVLP